MRGDYEWRKPATDSIIIWEANVCLCMSMFALDSKKMVVFPSASTSILNAQGTIHSLSPVLLHRAAVKTQLGVFDCMGQSKGQGLDFRKRKCTPLALQGYTVRRLLVPTLKFSWIILEYI